MAVVVAAIVLFTLLLALYLGLAIVVWNSFFHRVWSVALLLLLFLTALLYLRAVPKYDIPLSMSAILVSVVCFSLSPVQVLFSHAKTCYRTDRSLEIFTGKGINDAASQAPTVVDIVAVHGLASNPKTTWMSHKCAQDGNSPDPSARVAWLRDFLSEDVPNARVMAFNHNTGWETNALSKSLSHYGDDLLRALQRVRQTDEEKSRPIILIGHSFGGLVIKQALVTASGSRADGFYRTVTKHSQGFIFLGTPHKGARLTVIGKVMSLFGHWKGSSTSLLELMDSKSYVNQELHRSFMQFLIEGCGLQNTICVFEAVKESLLGFPITHCQVVEESSAIIDGSVRIGFEKKHRDIQRFQSPEDENYQDILVYFRNWIEQSKERHLAGQAEKTEEQQDCLKSLAFPEMHLRGNEIKEEAFETCEWLLKHEYYTDWLRRDQALLWLKGKPGAGKSTLLKYALREGKSQASREKLVVASFFFHGRGAPIQKTAIGLFRSLLHQILDQIPELLSEFTSIWKKRCETEGRPGERWEWHETELREFLEKAVPRLSKPYSIRIYVDALDECGEEVARDLILHFRHLISRVPTEAKTSLNLCFSCRHYPIKDYGLTICVEDENEQDIRRYVRNEIKTGFSDPVQAEDLETQIVWKASGVFQWVVLVVSIVLTTHSQGKNFKFIQKKLQEVPPELESLYEEILKGIDNKDLPQSLQLMQWICFAFTPLSLDELRFAMAVDADSPFTSLHDLRENSMDYAESNEQMEQRVKYLSGGLVEVKKHWRQRVPQFIHQSVKDYLMQSGLQKLDSSSKYSVTGSAHFRLSRSCVRYLSMEEVIDYHYLKVEEREEKERERAPVHEKLVNEFLFLRYATSNWLLHAEKVEAERICQDDLLGLLHWPSPKILYRWSQIFRIFDPWHDLCPTTDSTLLHIAAAHGLSSVVAAIVASEGTVNINSRDTEGRTPLSWAAGEGHEPIVTLLVKQKGVNVNSEDVHSKTPFIRAAEKGQEAVFKLLMRHKDVEVDSRDKEGQSPLSWAAERGHEAVVKLLMEQEDVEVDSRDHYGGSPLSFAAGGGHEAVVKLLIERDDVEVDSRDCYGRSPLFFAAGRGHEAVVKLLMEQEDVEVDSRDHCGGSPLSFAAAFGREAVVKLLMEQEDVEVDSRDEVGQSSLLWAAKEGHEAVVKLLIERDDVEVDSRDKEGRSSLSWAAEEGHEAVVKLLADREDVDTFSKDQDGLTPQDWAARYGRKEVVELLESYKSTD